MSIISYYNNYNLNYYMNMKRYIDLNILPLANSPWQNEVIENLWLGCSKSQVYFRFFDYKINMAADLKIHADMHEKIYDNPSYNKQMYNCFDRITSIIHEKLSNKKRVLVFCYQGVSRSATIVVAYLMKYYNLTKDIAVKYIRTRRHCLIELLFDVALTQWEETCRNEKVSKKVLENNITVNKTSVMIDELKNEVSLLREQRNHLINENNNFRKEIDILKTNYDNDLLNENERLKKENEKLKKYVELLRNRKDELKKKYQVY